ncbi:MAG: hypothetical protein AB7I42_03895 [Bradyrhizobium sp.]|uniref:hypothetical protein n=1 Tax=Bradyrhizobium sp. TaxID=376 RepID=UPI00353F8C24
MNWSWASSLDHIWRSPEFPMWAMLAAAVFFAILLLIILVRAEKSVANGALAVITLLAVGAAVAATGRGIAWPGTSSSSPQTPARPAMAALPAMSCIDDLAGETVLTACEKVLFGSPESAAAAVAYAASRITRLTSLGDLTAANHNMTSEEESLRRSVERDRYGLMAYVLMARDHCTPQACPAFRALSNSRQIMANMDDRVYEALVMRYSVSWGASPPAVSSNAAIPSGALAALPPPAGSVPTGKPTTMIDFPSAASTPPVNIMTPEPGAPGSAAPPPRAAAPPTPTPPVRPAAAPPAAQKKQAASRAARAPTRITPPSSPPPAPDSADDKN